MDSDHTCLAVISVDSALKKDEDYYPVLFLKQYKYIQKKVIRHITDDLESPFDDSDDSDDSNEEQIKSMRLIRSEKAMLKK